MNRREFIKALMIGYMYNLIVPSNGRSADAIINYSLPNTGDMRLLHITDTHAQLEPNYFREPNINLGTGITPDIDPAKLKTLIDVLAKVSPRYTIK